MDLGTIGLNGLCRLYVRQSWNHSGINLYKMGEIIPLMVPCLSALILQTLVMEGLISEYTFLFIPETTSDLLGSIQVLYIYTFMF